MLYICTISSISKDKKRADIAIPEKENMMVTDVQFLNISQENIPDIGDTVVALFEDKSNLGRGFILGKVT